MSTTNWHAEMKYQALLPTCLQVRGDLEKLGSSEALAQYNHIHEAQLKVGPSRREAAAARAAAEALEERLSAAEDRVQRLCGAVSAVANEEEGTIVLSLPDLGRGDATQLGRDVLRMMEGAKGLVGAIAAMLRKAQKECGLLRIEYKLALKKSGTADLTLQSSVLNLESLVLGGRSLLLRSGIRSKARRAKSRQRGRVSLPVVTAPEVVPVNAAIN